jgi:hypothetical protein
MMESGAANRNRYAESVSSRSDSVSTVKQIMPKDGIIRCQPQRQQIGLHTAGSTRAFAKTTAWRADGSHTVSEAATGDVSFPSNSLSCSCFCS